MTKLFYESNFKEKNKSHVASSTNKLSVDQKYEDPFGNLDENVMGAVGTEKLKSEVKQVNTDKKKAVKKVAVDKKEATKKESGIFSSLFSSVNSGVKSIAKSDFGKQVGGVLKDSSVSVANNLIQSGTNKLNEKVEQLNNTISGNSKEKAILEIEKAAIPEVGAVKYEDPFEGLDENLYGSEMIMKNKKNNKKNNDALAKGEEVIDNLPIDSNNIRANNQDEKDLNDFSKKLDNINLTDVNNNTPPVILKSLSVGSSGKKRKTKKIRKSGAKR